MGGVGTPYPRAHASLDSCPQQDELVTQVRVAQVEIPGML